ncbi:MAG: AMP-binding protein [Balneolaceae bacterium]
MSKPIPFRLPDPDAVFLHAAGTEYHYMDLYRFAAMLKKALNDPSGESGSPPVAFRDQPGALPPFIIASCWLLQIPFLPLAAVPDPEKENEVFRQLPAFRLLELPEQELSEQEPAESGIDNRIATEIITCPDLPESFSSQADEDTLTGSTLANVSDRFTTNPEETMAILQTSGTTGQPKLVPIRRSQHLDAATASFVNHPMQTGDYWLLTLPLHHAGGVNVILRSLLYGSAIWKTEKADTDTLSEQIRHNRKIRTVSLVPTQLKRLLDQPGFRPHSRFHGVLVGGGPISAFLLQKCRRKGVPAIASYGMTETFGQIAVHVSETPDGPVQPERKQAGQPTSDREVASERHDANQTAKELPHQEAVTYRIFQPNRVQARTESDEPFPAGEEGLLWLKGPQLFSGYLARSPESDNPFDTDGWFNTGDYGQIVRDGIFTVGMRRTDRIVSGGENLVPAEIEEVLIQIPGILEAGVTGIPDPEWGEAAIAIVTMEKGTKLDEEALRMRLRTILPSYKIPKQIVQAKDLPKTDIGKLVRRELPGLFYKLVRSNR